LDLTPPLPHRSGLTLDLESGSGPRTEKAAWTEGGVIGTDPPPAINLAVPSPVEFSSFLNARTTASVNALPDPIEYAPFSTAPASSFSCLPAGSVFSHET
jgi:hypothetical protein